MNSGSAQGAFTSLWACAAGSSHCQYETGSIYCFRAVSVELQVLTCYGPLAALLDTASLLFSHLLHADKQELFTPLLPARAAGCVTFRRCRGAAEPLEPPSAAFEHGHPPCDSVICAAPAQSGHSEGLSASLAGQLLLRVWPGC